MVAPTRRRLHVVELLLAVTVCSLVAASAAGSPVPQPDGHGALHALSSARPLRFGRSTPVAAGVLLQV